VLDNPGSVEDGNDGVRVLLASPTWHGELPRGVKRVIQGDSSFLGTLTRTQLIDPKDLPNVKKIQSEYKLQPLSAYLGEPAPEPAPARIPLALVDGQGREMPLDPSGDSRERRATLDDFVDQKRLGVI
jgi:hypothetical protein